MKFTLLRKDKSNVLHVSTRTLEQFFNRMAGTRKLPACEVVLTFEALSQPAPLEHRQVLSGTFKIR